MNRARRSLARVDRVASLGPGMGRVDLVGSGIGRDVGPGQFAMLAVPQRPDCILMRPFSYYLAVDDDHISFLIRDVGQGTHALLSCRSGEELSILGPLGNRFPEPEGSVWCIAGGVGAAPFGPWLKRNNVRLFFGSRNASDLGFAESMAEAGAHVEVSTDDGSAGFSGTVVDLLADRLKQETPPNLICVCGPSPMMAAAAKVTKSYQIPTWVSLEARMGCGIGVCRGCAHRDSSGGWRCICVDGPVYRSNIIFGD